MKKTIIDRMLSIVKQMTVEDEKGKKNFSLDKWECAATDIRSLSRTLGLTPMETVLLTAIIEEKSSSYRTNGGEVAEYMGLEYLQFLSYSDDLESLRKKGYIMMDKDGDIIVPKTAMNAIKKNLPVVPDPVTGLDTAEILSRIKKILMVREENFCDTDEAIDEMVNLMRLNPGTSIAATCLKYLKNLRRNEPMVLFGLVYRYHFHDDDQVGWHDFDDYLTEEELSSLRSLYRMERLILQENGVIEYSGDEGLFSRDYFHIKDEIKDAIFADVGGVRKKKQAVSASRMIEASAIARKELFYNPSEARQVAQLGELLSEERYAGIREAMQKKNLRTGFTCLFYGSPGTGKTETAYQLARSSGRDVFIVDVSQIKSCWVGESEQNLKDVFNKYRECVRRGGTTPILLFNEADAVLGIRQEGAQRAVDKMENSLQNIILQEMEDLDGILIATTNLTSNLDKAFERRFLYKIRFEKPSVEASSHIWRSMIPELSEAEAIGLAREYPFSGGQIENVSRKRTIRSLISGEEPSFSEIRNFCAEELIEKGGEKRKIGF